MTLREIAKDIAKNTRCTCDLDNWEPDQSTGHSWVCIIHKLACERFKRADKPLKEKLKEDVKGSFKTSDVDLKIT